MSKDWRRWITVLASICMLALAPAAQAQDDILDEIEAELRKEEEAKKAAAKAAKNEEKFQLNYRKTVAKGDALLKSRKYDEAITAYQEAKKWGPLEKYPDEKIAEAKELKTKAAEEAKQAEIDEKYKSVIVKADANFESKKYKESIPLYQEAAKLKPGEAWPQDQIGEAKKLQAQKEEEERKAAEAAKLEANYKAAMKAGDEKLGAKDYDGAVASYESAGKLKPGEQLPKSKIAEAKRLKEEAAKLAAQQKLDADYAAAVGKADDLFKQKKWDESVVAYQAALKIKPGEAHPKTQISEAGRMKEEEKQNAIRAKYDALISEADGLLKASSFDQAKSKYEEASKVLPSETYPATKMKECDDLKLQAEKAKIKAQYDALVKEADALLEAEKFDEAKAKYKEALVVLPHESHPNTMIAEADRRKEEKAQQATRAQYDEAITQGNDLLANEKFDEAIAQYKAAEKILPSESKTAELIAQAEKLKADNAAAAKQAEYNAAITAAEGLLKEEKFDEAIAGFEAAGKILPGQSKTAELISEARKLKEAKAEEQLVAQFESILHEGEKLLAEKQYDAAISKLEEAHQFYPKENKTAELIAEAKNMQEADKKAAIQAEFDQKVNEGESLIREEKFDEAIATFRAAEGILPGNSKTTELIAETNRLKEEKARQEAEKEFAALLKTGDEHLANEKFSEAREQYRKAKNLVPTKALEADKKIEEATRLEKEKTEREMAQAEAADREAKVAALVSESKSLEASENYAGAHDKLSSALLLDPENSGVKSDLERVSGLLSKQEAEKQAQLDADKAARLKAEQEGKADALLAQAASSASSGDYRAALSLVDQALGMIPNYGPAVSKQSEYQTQLDAAVAAEKEAAAKNAAEKAAQEEQERQVAQLIAQGDQFQSTGKLNDAKQKYEEALSLDGSSALAQQKINDINAAIENKKKEENAKQLAQQQAADKAALDEKVNALIEQGNQAMASEDWSAAQGAYEQALALDATSSVAQSKLNLAKGKIAAMEQAERDRAKAEQEKQAAAALAQAEEEKKQQIQALAGEADAAYNSGDLNGAKAKYQQVLALDASHSMALTRIGQIDDRMAKEEEERLALEKAEQDRLKAEKEKQDAQARAQAEEEKKQRVQSLASEGDAAYNSGNLTAAKEKYQQVLALDATHALALTRMGQIDDRLAQQEKDRLALEEAEKRKQAQANLKRTEQEKKDQIASYIALGDDQLADKKYSEALDSYEKALDIDPSNTESQGRVAHANKLKTAEDKMAADRKEKVRQEEVNNYLTQGKLKAIKKDFMGAKYSYEQALELDPGNKLATEGLSAIQSEVSALEAEAAADEARRKEREALLAKVELILDAGDNYFAGGQYTKAVAEYQKGLELDPMNHELKESIRNAKKMEERKKQIMIAKTHHLPRPKPEGFKTEQLTESSVRKDKIKYQNELGRAYPEGVTEEVRKAHRKSLTYRFVVLEGVGTEYLQARHDWGGIYYFKNGEPITPYIWQLETQDPGKATY